MAFEMLLFVVGFGFLLGIKHAFDADHIAAVSTFVAKHKSIRTSTLIGTVWGFGHTATLIIAGIIVLVFRISIPNNIALGLEFLVGLMLIALGINALIDVAGKKVHTHVHKHGKKKHFHQHIHGQKGHRHYHKSFLVGMVHGLAGSAALMLLVLATISSALEGLVYIILFGIGSVLGMLIVTTLIGASITIAVKKVDQATKWIIGMAGIFSLAFGLFLVYEVGFIGMLV